MDIDIAKAAASCDDDEKQQQHLHILHVLAVDDSNLDRKLLERLLTLSSYQVTCVDSGDKALEYLGLLDDIDEENHQYIAETSSLSATTTTCLSNSSSHQEISKVNLIMTDYSMPGISGYDLLKRIKDSNSWKDVPVVVMSSENVPSRINMCLEGGAEEFLLKPVKLSDLKTLHSHLLSSIVNHPNNCDHHNCITTVDHNPIEIMIGTEDTTIETEKNCSNSNKRKLTTSKTSLDLSDIIRPRVQELHVS